MANAEEAYADVLEVCALMQCLGFSVKTIDNRDTSHNQDAGGVRNVVINCQSSGLRVVMEGGSSLCSCPLSSLQTSGFWQVSAVTGGKKRDTETGSSILASLPKGFREKLTTELRDLVRAIRGHNESQNLDSSVTSQAKQNQDANESNNGQAMINVLNRSVSMLDLKKTPEPETDKLHVKPETPTRYRSLDTLRNKVDDPMLPPPKPLNKMADPPHPTPHPQLIRRQSTYSIASIENTKASNRTSSPIQQTHNQNVELVSKLLEVEDAAEDLRERITVIIKELADGKLDSSMSSMALDVSKISVLKGTEGIAQYASSPNISEHKPKPRTKLFESASTMNLASNAGSMSKVPQKMSKLRKLSPNFFSRKESPSLSERKTRLMDVSRSCPPRPKIVMPVQRTPKIDTSVNKSGSSSLKKKYSHIKSTIPRFTAKKDAPAPTGQGPDKV